LNPVWNKYGEFIIFDPNKDYLTINAWDDDRLTRDDPLGQAEIPLTTILDSCRTVAAAADARGFTVGGGDSGSSSLSSTAAATADSGFWVKLDNADSGKIRLSTQWFVPSLSYADFELSKSESLTNPGVFSTAILLIHVDSCSLLPGVPSPYVEMSLIGQPNQETDIVQYTKNPVYQQNFAFLVRNPESDDLNVAVLDSNIKDDADRRKKPLGTLKVITSDLLRRASMEYLCQPWKLATSGFEDSNIIFSLKLIFFKPFSADCDGSSLDSFSFDEDRMMGHQPRTCTLEAADLLQLGGEDGERTSQPPSLSESMRSSSISSCLDGFEKGGFKPEVFMSFDYDLCKSQLEVNVRSAQWVKIPRCYEGFVTLRLIRPNEVKRDQAKRKTKAVPLSDDATGTDTLAMTSSSYVHGGQLLFEESDEKFEFEKVPASTLNTMCVEVKLKAAKQRKKWGVSTKATVMAQTTIALADLDLVDPGEDRCKVKSFSLCVGQDSKSKTLSRQATGGSLGQLLEAHHTSTTDFVYTSMNSKTACDDNN